MKLKNLATALMMGVLTFFINGTVFAETAKEDHKAETLKHIDAGIAEGKQGHADVLVTHAKEALKHAKMQLGESTNPMMERGAKGIKAAIKQGEQGNAASATQSLEEAKAEINVPHSGAKDSPY
jgi:hypothetical protein